MTDIPQLIDLTKLPVNFELSFSKTDAVLLVTTGGIGYLAKELFRFYSEKRDANLELQAKNLAMLLNKARKMNAAELQIVLGTGVPLLLPSGAKCQEVSRAGDTVQYRIMFNWSGRGKRSSKTTKS